MGENRRPASPGADCDARARRADPTHYRQRAGGLPQRESPHRLETPVYPQRSEAQGTLRVEATEMSWCLPQEGQIGRKCQNRCGRFQHGTSRRDNFWWKSREDLLDDPGIRSAKLRCPGSLFQVLTRVLHAIQEQQDRWEMTAGDHRVGTFETPPHRDRTGTARFAKG